jgi:site-specific DNA recombinase
MNEKRTIRAAIYTRKSTDEGLDQEFNSLDAQAEACAAYIASQRSEGWRALPDRYDDGGISGGTLDRPALQRLLAEIDAGRVDMVVVYKIDRLTRSLADFARLVDRLEAAGCSFVSVTQSFNTATSMGRLTLNMLLSFAQFEREVIAERVRDKIAASKKKGLWMGGLAPLGYDKHPDPTVRSLVVNDREAETVNTIFRLYDEIGCLRRVADEAERIGIRSKRRVFESGKTRGGGPLSRGQIHFVLTNPIYLGKIRHKAETYEGQHEAILDQTLWDRVQAKLQEASARARLHRQSIAGPIGAPSPLTGRLFDETGDRLTPTHTTRHGKRLRYYVSNRLLKGGTPKDPTGWRLPSPDLERTTVSAIAAHLEVAATRQRILHAPDATRAKAVALRAEALAERLRAGPNECRHLLASVQVAPGALHLKLDAARLAAALDLAAAELDRKLLAFDAPFRLRRRGAETRIVAGEREAEPDPTLVRRLADAHRWMTDLKAGRKLTEIAKKSGHSPAYIRTRAPLAFLSPRIQKAIMDGTQPVGLTLAEILRQGVPLDWSEQEQRFGFTREFPRPCNV